jgi:8-oxo-dGTP diphosphatase
VYEAVWGVPLEPNNFRRKVLSVPGFVVPEGTVAAGRGRPSPRFRAGPAAHLQPAMLRPGS